MKKLKKVNRVRELTNFLNTEPIVCLNTPECPDFKAFIPPLTGYVVRETGRQRL